MKDLKDYILEAEEQEQQSTVEDKKVFTFDFAGLENSKETVESIQQLDEADGVTVTVEGEKVTVEVTKKGVVNIDKLHELIQDFTHNIRTSTKIASNEAYAQLTKKFANILADMDDYIDQVNSEEE